MNTTDFKASIRRVDKLFCPEPDAYLIASKNIFQAGDSLAWLGEFMVWEGSIAWNATLFGSIASIVWFIFIFIPWVSKPNESDIDDDASQEESHKRQTNRTIRHPGSKDKLKDWVLSEEETRQGGATFLSFSYWVAKIYVTIASAGSFLTWLHWISSNLNENPKTIMSTTLGNIGMVGLHTVFHSIIVFWPLNSALEKHGKDRKLNALMSRNARARDSHKNKRWLKIDNVPIDSGITEDMITKLFESLFGVKKGRTSEMQNDGAQNETVPLISSVHVTQNISELIPVLKEHRHEIEVIEYYKEHLDKKDNLMKFSFFELFCELRGRCKTFVNNLCRKVIRRKSEADREELPRFRMFRLTQFLMAKLYEMLAWIEPWNAWMKSHFTAVETCVEYHVRREAYLREKLIRMMKDVPFSGTVFIQFSDKEQAKRAKRKLNSYKKPKNFWSLSKITYSHSEKLKVHNWRVHYAPLPNKINWIAVKPPRSWWYRLARTFLISICFVLFVVIFTLPGVILREMQLNSSDKDMGWPLVFKAVVVPAAISFFTRFFLDILVDWLWNFNKDHKAAKDLASRFWYSFTLLLTLYMARMMGKKPLPIIFSNIKKIASGGDIIVPSEWECMFYPVHAAAIANAIIINTARTIISDLVDIAAARHWPRIRSFKRSLNPFHKFHDVAEEELFLRNFAPRFDICSNYAELACNFVLALGFYSIFPLLGPISFVCAILRMLSNRWALMATRKTPAEDEHRLHEAPVDAITYLAVMGPLVLFIYRVIQIYGIFYWSNSRLVARLSCPLVESFIYFFHLLCCYCARRRKLGNGSYEKGIPEKNNGDAILKVENEPTEDAYNYQERVLEYVYEIRNIGAANV